MTELDTGRGADRNPERESETGAAPPGPDGLPLVESTVAASRDGLAFADALQTYGDLVSYSAFGTEFVAVFDPEIVETVLVSRSDDFEKGEFEMAFGDLVAPDGLAFTEGARWRRQRTTLQSAFTPERIERYAAEMVEQTAALADGWADGETVALDESFSELTLRILTRALFDLDFDTERAAVVREATQAIGTVVDTFGLLSLLPDWVPTRSERRYERAMAALDDLVARLIRERRATAADRDDLLSLLVTAADADDTGIDAESLRDQLVTFLFAGHETTATALTEACWLLAGHPGVRDRLDAELDAVLGDRDPTVADLPALEYTEDVVREALRLYPPVYSLYRQPRAAVVLDGYRVPADTTLQLATYNIQRDDRWWDAPEEFRLGRWSGESSDADRPEYAYFPFGGGPRHCIGMRFAMTELKLAVATLARRVAFERRTRELDLSMGLTLDPGRVAVRASKRT